MMKNMGRTRNCAGKMRDKSAAEIQNLFAGFVEFEPERRENTIVTTLLDNKKYRARDFTDLYRKRWLAELFLRDIKISLGMDVLKCKTPEMVLKEVQMYIIASLLSG